MGWELSAITRSVMASRYQECSVMESLPLARGVRAVGLQGKISPSERCVREGATLSDRSALAG